MRWFISKIIQYTYKKNKQGKYCVAVEEEEAMYKYVQSPSLLVYNGSCNLKKEKWRKLQEEQQGVIPLPGG